MVRLQTVPALVIFIKFFGVETPSFRAGRNTDSFLSDSICSPFFRYGFVSDSSQWAASFNEAVTTRLIDLTRCCQENR